MDTTKLKPLLPNKCCFCFVTDDNYAKYLSVALTSFREIINPNLKYEIVILTNNLSQYNILLLTLIFKNYQNVFLRFYDCDLFMKNSRLYKVSNVNNKSYYLRIAILDILSNYEKVLYLDCDIVILKDPSELFDIDLKDKYAAVARDLSCYYRAFLQKEKLNMWDLALRDELINFVKLKDNKNYFNSGVMLFNVKMNLKDNIIERFINVSINRKQLVLPDQSVFNCIYKEQVIFLKQNWNVLPLIVRLFKENELYNELSLAHKHPYIIHYAGHSQPLYNKAFPFYNNEFLRFATQSLFYQDLLLENINNKLDNLINNINVNYRRSFIKRLLRKIRHK